MNEEKGLVKVDNEKRKRSSQGSEKELVKEGEKEGLVE